MTMKQTNALAVRRGLSLLAALSLLLLLAGCGGQEAGTTGQPQTEPPAGTPAEVSDKPASVPSPAPTPSSTPTPTPVPEPEPEPEPDPVALALEQYRAVAGQADTYNYESTDASTGAYRYALVQMAPEDPVPALLLEQDTTFGISSVLLFRYDVDSGAVLQAAGTMMEGVASAGGYRGGLSAAGDGYGLLSTEFSSGNGMGSTSRVTLDGDTLRSETIWEGNVFDDTDGTVEAIGFVDLDWHDVTDTAALDSWTPGTAPAPVEPQPEPSGGAAAPAADGDRTVFTGTLGAYSYSGVLDLQGQADPNPGSDMGETYYLILLDAPQTMTLRSGDGQSSRDGEVHLVDVSYVEGIAQYVGQHLTFSIDPSRTYWPSDASLPLGEPRTDDLHILS